MTEYNFIRDTSFVNNRKNQLLFKLADLNSKCSAKWGSNLRSKSLKNVVEGFQSPAACLQPTALPKWITLRIFPKNFNHNSEEVFYFECFCRFYQYENVPIRYYVWEMEKFFNALLCYIKSKCNSKSDITRQDFYKW